MKNTPRDRRRIVVALALLVALVPYVLCALKHVCMAGHMQHGPYTMAEHALDLAWVIPLVVAGVLCWKSNLRLRKTTFWSVVFLVLSRVLLGSGGGGLFLIEAPLLLLLVIGGIMNLFGGARDQRVESQVSTSADTVPQCRQTDCGGFLGG